MYKIIKLFVFGSLFFNHIDAFSLKPFLVGTLLRNQQLPADDSFVHGKVEQKFHYLRGISPQSDDYYIKGDDTTDETINKCTKMLNEPNQKNINSNEIIACRLFVGEYNK